ncbi:MAG TPA: flagellar hook basal-body protein [Bryobacteraceae bacterium]
MATMDPLTTAAASGLQARLDALTILANNLANTSTSGFKADSDFYSTYLAPGLAAGGDPTVGAEPVVERQWTNFSQATLVTTGDPNNLALSGPGFFIVNGPGGPLYTRNGSFQMSPKGVLVTAEGYPVQLAGGATLQTQSLASIVVKPDGEVLQDGNALGKLQLVDFPHPEQLAKAAGAYFENVSKQKATQSAAVVYQGKLETSNAGPAQSAAHLITLLRNFEMLQRAAKIGGEMDRQAIQQVASVAT